MTAAKTKERKAWLDLLRIAAAFLVIVNHTNSDVFRAVTPEQGTWTVSILWYYLSKLAVPLFVMVSGACLLGRKDSYAKVAWRFLRVLLALVLAAYVYFLYDAWVFYGLWPRMLDFGALFGKIWRGEVTDGFWYLYFYLGLMLTLPFWQRMAAGMEKKDYSYLMAVTFGIGAGWPLLKHYVPEAALPKYFDLSMVSTYVGLFFAGHYIALYAKQSRRSCWGWAAGLAVSLAVCYLLTRLEFDRVAPGAKYWFMDERSAPALPVIAGAVCAMGLCRSLLGEKASGKALAELGGCAFAIYLIQDLLIAESEKRLFLPLCQQLPSMAAVLLWELAVFGAALCLAWLARRIPGMKKIL